MMFSLIWDMDDTLYNLMLPFKNACESVLGIILEEPEAVYQKFRFYGDEVFEASQKGEISLLESRIYRFQKAMDDCGIPVSREIAVRFQEVYEQFQMKISLSEEMKRLFETCRRHKILMGMITNGPTEHQMKKIRALGLLTWIPREHMIISGEVGFMKPDTKIFQIAQNRMKLEPEKTFMIGDNYSSDIEGTMAVGWKTIWFNRRKKARAAESQAPEYTLYTEKELISLVDELLLHK